ncbi:MAG TPA: glycosyltransferase family 2 protein [Dehalococcoidia bacterium]|nr:glycosyltransferase family 2 protein [Dehalococcoidia bacterium]
MVIRRPLGEDDVDVSVVSWNSWSDLRATLPALAVQDYPSYRVVVVDNASTDATAESVGVHFPDVEVIRSARNNGYGAGNNLCFARTRAKYVAVINPDARPEPGWLRALVRALETHPHAALATSKVLLESDPARVNACGNDVHLAGIAYCRALMRHQDEFVADEPVAAVSGAAFVARRDVLDEIGGFDERFFMYMEDTELSMRARLAGYDVVLTPRSRVVHAYELSVPPWKFFYLERNRAFMLLNLFRWRTLALMAPALAAAEAGVWIYAFRRGPAYVFEKLHAYVAVVGSLHAVLRQRRRVQRLRRVRDADLLAAMTPRLPDGLDAAGGAITRLANGFFRRYAAFLRRAVRW